MPTQAATAAKATRQELIRAIRAAAHKSEWGLERAFERAGCSCRPKRDELELLEKERDRKMKALERSLKNTLGKRIEQLRAEIAEIDYAEHAKLHAMGWRASNFYAFWMMERLGGDDSSFLDQDAQETANEFAAAWLGGWRPKFQREGASSASGPTMRD